MRLESLIAVCMLSASHVSAGGQRQRTGAQPADLGS